jgi:hypothetical protein
MGRLLRRNQFKELPIFNLGQENPPGGVPNCPLVLALL